MINALVLKIVIVLLILCQALSVKAHVTLDYPQGGELFIVGETITIQWHVAAPHNTLNWDLFFSDDGGVTWDTLLLDIPTALLSYEWEIPDIVTFQGKIRIIQDNVDQNYLDISMNFTIAANTSPPILDAPAIDTVIECSVGDQDAAIQAWLNNHGGASATNFCGDLNWTNDFPGLSNDCGATGSALVTFTAADDCGLTMTNATLTVIDTKAPDINIEPVDLLVESDGQGNVAQRSVWLNTHAGAQASDVCSNVSWTNNYTGMSDDCGATGSATVIFMVTDACGNSISTTAAFTIADQIAPAILVPAHDTTITCTISNQELQIQHWLDARGGAQVYDVGGDVMWTHNYGGLTDGCGSTGSATVVFIATDECGNNISTSAILTIEDHTAPTINVQAQGIVMECSAVNQQSNIQHWLDKHGDAQATDGCGNLIWTHNYTGTSEDCGSSGMANVIFTVTDECGNSSTTITSISIEDTLPPSILTGAMDTTFLCGTQDISSAIENWLSTQGGAIASDLCGTVTWANNFSASTDTCGPIGSHNVIFTAMDECGNATSIQAILTIQDSSLTTITNEEQFNFRIYPNPASDFLNVVFGPNEFAKKEITLIDLYGKPLWSEVSAASEISIPLQNFSYGVYFLQVKTKEKMYSRKVMIH